MATASGAAEGEHTPYTFATWIFTLHVAGVRARDPEVVEICDAVLHAKNDRSGGAAGERLVAKARALLDGRDLTTAAAALFTPQGANAVAKVEQRILEEDRAELITGARLEALHAAELDVGLPACFVRRQAGT